MDRTHFDCAQTGCRSSFAFISENVVDRKSQGHKTRAPEGMSILAFLWISPFLRYLTPLTILSINVLGYSESSLNYIIGVFTDIKLPERCLRFHSLETPPVPYFKLHKRAYGIEISASLRFCHFPFANRYRLYVKASTVPKRSIGRSARMHRNAFIFNLLQSSTFALNLTSRSGNTLGIKTLYTSRGPPIIRCRATS